MNLFHLKRKNKFGIFHLFQTSQLNTSKYHPFLSFQKRYESLVLLMSALTGNGRLHSPSPALKPAEGTHTSLCEMNVTVPETRQGLESSDLPVLWMVSHAPLSFCFLNQPKLFAKLDSKWWIISVLINYFFRINYSQPPTHSASKIPSLAQLLWNNVDHEKGKSNGNHALSTTSSK